MISHYFTLKALCAELRNDCLGSVLRESYTQVKDEMALTLETPRGETRTLAICVGAGSDVIFLRDGRSRARKNSTDIFSMVFGSKITDLDVEDFSRVVTLTVGGYKIRIHLFGSRVSNVFLVDASEMVVATLKNGRELAGHRYETGKVDREVIDPGDARRLAEILADSDELPGKALKTAFPWLGKLYVAELLSRCRCDGTIPHPEFVSTAVEKLGQMLTEADRPSPRHYEIEGCESPLLSVIPIGNQRPSSPPSSPPSSQLTRSFATVNDAVRETYFGRKNRSGFELEREQLLETAKKDRDKIGRSLEQAKARADDDSAPEKQRRIGHLILTHIGAIRKGQVEAEITDEEGGGPTRIRLERALTPAGNANLYFDRARKAEKALEECGRRVRELSARLEVIDAWIVELQECDGPARLREITETRGKNKERSNVTLETAGGQRLPFRVFPIGDHYEVWVGKTSSDNELLTMKHAGPHDFWFHVRGASGSHVVLKNRSGGKDAPPREVIRAAARLAAYYSKMRRGGNVPVAYCERKYVKKPKNAPAGTVTLLREEIIFVTPGIP